MIYIGVANINVGGVLAHSVAIRIADSKFAGLIRALSNDRYLIRHLCRRTAPTGA